MNRILPSTKRWPLHDAAATRAIEQAAMQTLPPHALIERAGLAVARLALAVAPHARTVWVAAGGGNNGGDGMIAARHLAAAGKRVHVGLFGDVARLPDDARHAHEAARHAGVDFVIAPSSFDGADLVIDALLGIGAVAAPRAPIATAIGQVNAAGAPVLAVDIPSGLQADSGSIAGTAAVQADHTLSLLTLKPGLFTAAGRDHAGQVWLDDLDAAADPGATATAWLSGPPALPPRRHAQHKGSFGDAIVIGGAPGMAGAALLAASAALAAGAGRTYLVRLDGASGADAARPEVMARAPASLTPEWLGQATVICGCGGGQAIVPLLPLVLAHAARLVLDADGLNAVARDPALSAALAGRAAQGRPSVLTPHPLEAARLLGCSAAEIQADRLPAAQRLARRCAATVVLKGSGSVIAAADQPPLINPTGNARLGTAGSGDVLAGWVAGLWSADPTASSRDIAAAAVWQHGRAAEVDGRSGPLLALALIDALAALPR